MSSRTSSFEEKKFGNAFIGYGLKAIIIINYIFSQFIATK